MARRTHAATAPRFRDPERAFRSAPTRREPTRRQPDAATSSMAAAGALRVPLDLPELR
jgi:hypothetical protein